MFLDKLHERQRDPDERVRQEVVATICEAASEHITSISDQVLQEVKLNKHFHNEKNLGQIESVCAVIMSHYTMLFKYGKHQCNVVGFFFYFYFSLVFYIFQRRLRNYDGDAEDNLD